MKKTTYIIIAILAAMLIGETIFIYVLSRHGKPWSEAFPELYQGYEENQVVESDWPDLVTSGIDKINNAKYHTDDAYITVIVPEGIEGILTGVDTYATDTLIITSSGYRIIVNQQH